jgi:hypothetical protein
VTKRLLDMRNPKARLVPMLVHRYVVKEQGFAAGSKFAHTMIEELLQ